MGKVSQVIMIVLVGCSNAPSLQSDVATSAPEIERQTFITHPLPTTDDCPLDMVRINRFCIDRYEYPNIKGAYPDFAMSAFDAEKVCSDINKRLCSQDEWNLACSGLGHKTYPYGVHYKRGVCN